MERETGKKLKRTIILGATGSIGRNAVDVVATHPGELAAVATAALNSREANESAARRLGAKAYTGADAAVRAVEENDADICLVAMTGLAALAPVLAAIRKGMDVALATKEVLVMAGRLVTAEARKRNVHIIPVDSEHSAIFQCTGFSVQSVSRLVLTASGGPFLDAPTDMSRVTPEQALAHPRWKMGPKTTIDSATMMNKGFEVAEASWLFGVDASRIDILVHPESVVHSMVEFEDGATLAQLSPPDMRVAIQYALTWPDRLRADREKLDLARLGALTFRALDEKRFPGPGAVRRAMAAGGCAAAAMAAADELAVNAFLDGRLGFADIVPLVEDCAAAAPAMECDSPEAVAEACRFAKEFCRCRL